MSKMDIQFFGDTWMAVNSPSNNVKSMFYYITMAGHFYCDADYFSDIGNFDSMVLSYTVSGKGVLKYQNKSYTLAKGQLFILDCMEPQYIASDPNDLWETRWFHFNGIASRNYVQHILSSNGPLFTLPQSSVIPDRIKDIHDMILKKDIKLDILGSRLIVDILTELLLSNDVWSVISVNGDEFEKLNLPMDIQNLINKIVSDYSKPIHLELLAKDANMSKYYISYRFKKYTGYSPYEYLLRCRLNHAKILLNSTSAAVAEISERVGFESVSHFIKIFKMNEGITPLQFRKKGQ